METLFLSIYAIGILVGFLIIGRLGLDSEAKIDGIMLCYVWLPALILTLIVLIFIGIPVLIVHCTSYLLGINYE